MATTPRGIWTPDSDDDYSPVIDLQAMADTIDDLLARLPFAMAAGRLVLDQSYQTIALPPGRFTNPPRVVIQAASGASTALGATTLVTNETVDSFQARMFAGQGGGSSVACNWIAVQMTPLSANG